MLYLICPSCDLTTYSLSLWHSTDACPKCGLALDGHGVRARLSLNVVSITQHPRYRLNTRAT